MYGLKPDVDLSFLVGESVIQVRVGENEVILEFGDGISIMIASNLRIGRPGDARSIEEPRAFGREAIGLLGDAVQRVAVEEPGTTHIYWRSGNELQILDSWIEYESYTINHGGHVIVV